jgi:hypothetical protein
MAVVWMREWSSFSVEKPRKSGLGAHVLVQRQPGPLETRLISVSKQSGPWDTFASIQPGPNKYTTNQTFTSCISSSRLPCMQETNHAYTGRAAAASDPRTDALLWHVPCHRLKASKGELQEK